MSQRKSGDAKAFIRFAPRLEQVNGHPIGWILAVTHVDRNQNDHQAIKGRFLNSGIETNLPVGSILLYVTPAVNDETHYQSASSYRLESDGSVTSLNDTSMDWNQNFDTIRDSVAESLMKSFPNDKGRVGQKKQKSERS